MIEKKVTLTMTLDIEMVGWDGRRKNKDLAQLEAALAEFIASSNRNPHNNAYLAGEITREILTGVDDPKNTGRLRVVVSQVKQENPHLNLPETDNGPTQGRDIRPPKDQE